MNYTAISVAVAGTMHATVVPAPPSFCHVYLEGEPASKQTSRAPWARNAGSLSCAFADAGYMFTYWNSKASKEREAQIDRVNAQVCAPAVSIATEMQSCEARSTTLATGMQDASPWPCAHIFDDLIACR